MGQPKVVQVSISPADQLISGRDFSNLDRNKYDVNDTLQVAVLKPSTGSWKVFATKEIPSIGMKDIPFFSQILNAFQALYSDDRPQVYGVRKRQGHEVTVSENSKIQKVPVTVSLADNIDFIKMSLRMFAACVQRWYYKCPDLSC